jgi:hypothetical protein
MSNPANDLLKVPFSSTPANDRASWRTLDSGYPVKVEMSATDFQWLMVALEFAARQSETELRLKFFEVLERLKNAAYQSREG